MSIESPTSDSDFLDLLRAIGPLSVAELAVAMEVTPTAVRQRLTRMMSQGILQREAQRKGRGDSFRARTDAQLVENCRNVMIDGLR